MHPRADRYKIPMQPSLWRVYYPLSSLPVQVLTPAPMHTGVQLEELRQSLLRLCASGAGCSRMRSSADVQQPSFEALSAAMTLDGLLTHVRRRAVCSCMQTEVMNLDTHTAGEAKQQRDTDQRRGC